MGTSRGEPRRSKRPSYIAERQRSFSNADSSVVRRRRRRRPSSTFQLKA